MGCLVPGCGVGMLWVGMLWGCRSIWLSSFGLMGYLVALLRVILFRVDGITAAWLWFTGLPVVYVVQIQQE